jgi:isocitrate dehydrogenase kinase/phosphatase
MATRQTTQQIPTDLAKRLAETILHAFQAYHREFKRITGRAKGRFETSDWRGLQEDAQTRLELYRYSVNRAVDDLRHDAGVHVHDQALWNDVKSHYTRLIASRGDLDLAQSFYNSVIMRVVASVGIDGEMHFVGGELAANAPAGGGSVYTTYPMRDGAMQAVIRRILDDHPFAGGYHAIEAVTVRVAEEIDAHLQQTGWEGPVETVEMAKPVFYRGERAFLVGRICNHSSYVPLVLALANTSEGVTVDAVLLTEDEVSIIFSFTRWYFHVEVDKPSALVYFLKSILPLKPVAELYISLGYDKHGKTEFYRDLTSHLARCEDKFEMARGARGMVMVVFTLPSYNVVFKIIKDSFDYPKTTTSHEVRQRYYLVFKHDRGGRLVDAQEFTHLRFSKELFTPELLEELLRVASNTVSLDGDTVLIKHVYVERKLYPLDLYVRENSGPDVQEAIIDFGQSVKDLAATNIFPGDILLKNFGVTRHGRVVFYDYDELCLLTECNFRKMPETEEHDDEMSAQPWFSVGEHDVFPEEFASFLGLPPDLKELFTQTHGELFDADFWTGLQEKYRAGEVLDVLPYRESKRLGKS